MGTETCLQQPSEQGRQRGPATVLKPKPTRESPIKATVKNKGKGKAKRSTKRKTVSTTDPTPQEHQPVNVSAVPNPDPPEAEDHEQEIPDDVSELLGSNILNFTPLNPGNSTTKRPEDFIPIHSSTPARRQNFVSGREVLWISGQRSQFPMIDNSGASLAEADQRNSCFKIHLELSQHGYEMTAGDITKTFPLNITANKETKVTTVVVYKDKETAKRVTEAAKNVGIWGSRAVTGPDGQTAYFRAPKDTRCRTTNRKNPEKNEEQKEEDQQGQSLQGQSLPGTPQPTEELPRAVYTVEDDASSVEITEEVVNTTVPPGDELTPSEVEIVKE